jgi:hypothetical protein
MRFDLSTARRLVLKSLAGEAATRSFSIDNVESSVAHFYAQESGWTKPPGSDWRVALGPDGPGLVNEAIWDFIVQRVISFAYPNNLCLTVFGREVVRQQRWLPYDPDGYLLEFGRRAPRLFGLCQLYVAEALNCFRTGCFIAACVMVGAASEAAMNDLFQQLAGAMKASGKMPEVDAYERRLNKEPSFYNRYELFRNHFDHVRSKLPAKLTDDFDGQLVGVFHLIRQYRNEAGHPTGTAIEREAAFRNLALFVDYCRRIEEIGDWMRTNPDKLT